MLYECTSRNTLMKNTFAGLFVILFLAESSLTNAATITWTNTVAGTWNVAANWQPNQVPGPSDTVIIPLAATNGAAVDTNYTVNNLILNGGTVANTGVASDTLTVAGQINWTNGTLGCTVTNEGVLTLAGTNGVDYQLTTFLCNVGTMNLASGNLLINYCGYNYGGISNAAGGLINIEHDANIDVSQNQFGLCPPPFYNAGTIRKTAGTGVSYLFPPINNYGSGIIDAQSGAISFNGGGNLDGTLQSEGTGEFLFGTNIYGSGSALSFSGNLTSTNSFINGADFIGSGTNNGVLTWLYGSIGGGGANLNNGARGTLILAGTNGDDYPLNAVLYNAGTIRLISGNLLINFCGSGEGELVNEPGGLVDIINDVSIDSPCEGQIENLGMIRKSGGTGTTDIGAFFNNGAGTLDVESGIVALTNNYNLSGGVLLFGISSLTAYGRVSLSGENNLTGGLNVQLNDSYVPAVGNTFALLNYPASSGLFTTQTLPPWINWQTNYATTDFTLSVINLNGRSVLSAATLVAPGQFSFQFTGNPTGSYSVLATTNLLLPLTDWTVLGSATLVSNDLFEYVDTHATNAPQRFYQLRNPQ